MWKVVLFCVALSFCVSAQKAQLPPKKEYDKFAPKNGVSVLYLMSLSRTTWGPALKVPAGWEARFLPPREGQTLKEHSGSMALELGGGVEPTFKMGSWQLGFPVYYTVGVSGISGFVRDRPAAYIRLHWWDPVVMQRMTVRRLTPWMGVSFTKGRLRVEPSVQKVSLFEENFKGKDCQNCPNSSFVIERHQVGRGVAKRLDLSVPIKDYSGVGWFFEKGPKFFTIGMNVRFNFFRKEPPEN